MPAKGTKKSKITGRFISKDEYETEIKTVVQPKQLKNLADGISKFFAMCKSVSSIKQN